MAVHAVHRPDMVVSKVVREGFFGKNSDNTLRIGQPHPWSFLKPIHINFPLLPM
jgi:hypothetical protein